jgi:hypothetical protein
MKLNPIEIREGAPKGVSMGGKLIDDTYLEIRSWIGGSRFRGSSTEYSNLMARYNNYDIFDCSDAITIIEVRREKLLLSRILKSYFPFI